MAAEIIARLGLNAENFSKGLGKAVAGLGPQMEQAAKTASAKFDAALAPGLASAERRIKKTLEQAAKVSVPGDALTLDVSGARASALALEQQAASARSLALAMEEVQRESQQVSKAQQLELVAAQSVAQKFEEQARAARNQATALEQVQAQLGRVAGAQASAAASSGAMGASLDTAAKRTGNFRYAMVGAGQQLQDIAISLQGGQRASVVFAQQLPQLGFALSGLAGSSKKSLSALGALGGFLSGPWGLIVPAAAFALGPLIDKIFDTGDEAAKAKPKVDALTAALDELRNHAGKVDLGGSFTTATTAALAADGEVRRLEARLARLKATIAKDPLFRDRGVDAARIRQQYESGVKETQAAIAAAKARKKAADDAVSAGKDALKTQEALAKIDADRAAAADRRSGSGTAGSTRASNDNDAARAMERQRDAAADLSAKLADIVQRERDSADIARIRAERGEDAADRVQAELEITRQFPELEGKRVGDITSYHGTSVKVTQEMLDQLAVAKQLVGAEVDRNKEAKKREKFADIGREGLAAVDQIFEDYEKQAKERQEAERRRIEDLAYLFEDVFRDGTGAIWDNFKREGERVLADFASKQLLSVLGKAGIGGDVLGKIGKNASLGAALGPAVNNILGMKGSSTGGALGGAIGSFIPIPGGNIIGSIIGSTIGGLLKKAKYGTTVLSNGQLSTAGNSGSARSASVGGANSIQEGLANIAEALGGDIGSYNVSIGTYKGKWRVSPSGYGGKLKVKNGAVDFGKDGQAEAIRFAISDALSDGAIKGISDAAQRILKSGQDLDKALQKAVDIESIPKLLKARLDPLGAALEAVDDKFSKLAATLKEGGASAEQIADARKLWQLEREDTLNQIGQASAGLKDFLSGLKAGSASPFSLRDQEKAAREALAPFQAKIAAGQTIDVDAFTQAADTFLSVERGIYGSTGPFFEALAQVSQLTEQAIAKIDAQTSGTGAAKDPFAEMTATAAQATATNTQSAAQILEQQTQMLADIRNALAGGGIPANAAWLSTWRGFVRAA